MRFYLGYNLFVVAVGLTIYGLGYSLENNSVPIFFLSLFGGLNVGMIATKWIIERDL